jgi:hypothetical protein
MLDGITIVSLSPREISILCPPDSGNRFFLYFGVAALLLAGFIYFKWRSWLWCIMALWPGVILLIGGCWAMTSVTTINASADTGALVVHNTVAGISTGQHTYQLTEIEGFRIGFQRGGRYLYADLRDGYTSQLLPAGYRAGYQHAADALNAFLGSLGQGAPQQTPSQ